MQSFVQDLGYALRTLRRNPGFALVAILTLALGIGATTAIFSVVNSVLLRPLPFQEQDRLAVVWESQKTRGYGTVEVSYPNYVDWRDQNKAFDQLAILGSTNTGMTLTGNDEPLQVQVATVSSNFFYTLGVSPKLGRVFTPEEDRLGTRLTAVLSHGLWQRLYGSDPKILGKAITLNGNPYTVVGVMGPELKYPRNAELWVPVVPVLGKEIIEARVYRVFKAIGRLNPNVSFEQALSNLVPVSEMHEKEYPESNAGFGVAVLPLTQEVFGDTRPTLLILLGAVMLVLLIASANVANLLLARTTGRSQEIGIRTALGADSSRLVRQLLTEGMVLGLLGGLLGVVIASLGIQSLLTLAPDSIPRLEEIRIDGVSLAFTALLSLVTVLIFGLAPALQGSRKDLHTPLREGGKRSSGNLKGRRLRSFLVVSEVTLALVLLVGAGLMIQSVIQLQRVDPGFDPDRVLTFRLRLPENLYPQAQQRRAFFDRLLERVGTLPGVESASGVLQRPLEDAIGWDIPYAIEGQSWTDLFKNPYANLEAVTPGYFQTMRVPILKGREFTRADRAGSQLVAVVSRSLAERYFPGQEAVGKRIRRVEGNEKLPWMTIVGVAEDVRYRGWSKVTLDLYVPAEQNPFADYIAAEDFVIRTQSDPLALAQAVRREVYGLDPNQSVASVTTMQSLVDKSLAAPRFTMILMGIFGALALTLAAIGLYGVLSYSVNQRKREIGIRMALGARKEEVLRMVLRQGLSLTLTGIGAGIVAAFLLTRFMVSQLYGVKALDPVTFLLVPVLLVVISLVATFLPAWRASRADPVSVLRAE